jgi:putative restriction endonuclease
MNFWWVNQKRTYRHEIGEGYMWSPKRQQDGNKHFSYEYMKHVQPGDIIFSYANAAIIALGIASTHFLPGGTGY